MPNVMLRKFEKVCAIIDKHDNNPAHLIPILQEIQNEYRYLPEDVMTFLATSLGLSPAKVFGVASFYAHFSLSPKGKYVIRLCDGTACHVKGSHGILETLYAKLKLDEKNHTTPDMLFTVETVACLGACGIAPVVVINEKVYGQVTAQKAADLVDEIMMKEDGSHVSNKVNS
ncbi:MAG: NAD(P)H-dependent oxidoreductase subunit E [Candidatus Omnitrophica bacterium]|nr:NAD(P)H-dependent oxidoreductase subunit E [Candidatus Omnitrophota bacterium]